MSKAGQYNYKGINAQAWAAMSLFLQYLRDPKFSSIQLELANFEDFNLVFDDGKKIICESKDRKEKFSYPHLKILLENISNRGTFSDKDEILVICSKANSDLVSDVRNIKYFTELQKKFTKKIYPVKLLPLLKKVHFWVVPASFNKDVIYSLFAELINFWLPPEDIKRFVDSILIQKIYKGSANGTTYNRSDIFAEIDKFKKEVQDRSDYFNLRTKKEEQFKALEKIATGNKKITLSSSSISALSIRWDLMSFAADRLKERNDLDLKKWGPLWQLNRVYYFTFSIFRIFENNIQTDRNCSYVLSYIKKYTKTIRGFYRSDFFDVDVVKIVAKIIESANGAKYLNDAFAITKDLITFNKNEFFYLKDDNGHGTWEKEQVCKLLIKIYGNANSVLRQKVFDLLISAFNITEDDGEFSHHAPKEVYSLINQWLNDDFLERFDVLVKIIANQYERYYKKFGSKIKFDGWEHMGGGISYHGNYMGSSYHISERHFVSFILAPSIRKFYDADRTRGWKFIKETCISSEAQVKKYRPDFLNRSVYEIVLERYKNDDKKVSEEAFQILKEFILSKKGIPHKTDLIFQSVLGSDLSHDKKWRLVEISIKAYNIPVNPFVEGIVTDLAKNGHRQAELTLGKWFTDKKYYGQFRFDRDHVSTIRSLLNDSPKLAIKLFEDLVASEYIKNGSGDKFNTFGIAALLNEILRKDYGRGIAILRALEEEKVLNEDQQIIYTFSLFNSMGNDESDSVELLSKVYQDIVDPFLKKYSNIKVICTRLTLYSCRQAFVQFAARLVAHQDIANAVRIVRIFVDDPHPYLPNHDPDDPKNEYSEHQKILKGDNPVSITSVRGWCGWVLMKCAVLDGRKQMPEIIDLTEKLINDKNYYVVHMACFALSQIGKVRLTFLPNNKDTLFLNDDREKALKLAKRVEDIVFLLIDRFMNWPPLIQKGMIESVLSAIDPFRALNESRSLELVTYLSQLPVEIIGETAPLFLYFAEFRKDNYVNWRFALPGLFDDLGPDKYDNKKFKKILSKVVVKIQAKDPDQCFRFVSSLEHIMRESDAGSKEKYSKLFFGYCDKYFSGVYSHNVFLLIYQVINQKLASNEDFDRWYGLYIKCLKVEAEFYKKVTSDPENKKNKIYRGMYWWPDLLNSQTLESIYKFGGAEKFIAAASILFSFPVEFELHESEDLISLIKKLPKTDKRIKAMKKYLREKNPSKYWELK